MSFAKTLDALAAHRSLTQKESYEAMTLLMLGKVPPAQIAGYLMALRVKGETVAEITGSACAMRDVAIPVKSRRPLIVDTCGTGGDGRQSFNVSTAAAFVAAGAGLVVAKHGNRSVSSRCGSADLLEALGLPVESSAEMAARCLDEVGLAFLFAPSFHPAMKHAMPVRRELGVRTLFNLLGPLTNPARPHVQLIGVFDRIWLEPVAHVLVELGAKEGLVVHGQGHDEIVLSGETEVAEIIDGKVSLRHLSPEEFGLKIAPQASLEGADPSRNLSIFNEVLEGKPSAYRDAVCMNAAALLQATERLQHPGKPLSLVDAFNLATKAIDSGAARRKLSDLRAALRTSG